MGYVFLWLEAMASALLLVAVVFSLSGRLKKWPALWPSLMAILIALTAILVTVATGFLFFENIRPQWLFPYSLIWTLVFIATSWILIRRGRRKTGDTPSAASWPRSRIAGAFIIALALQWLTMDSLDNAAKMEAVAAQASALNRVQTLFPASPPHDQNAAELYMQFDRELDKIFKNKHPSWVWDAGTGPAVDPTSKEVQKFFSESKQSIALAKQAAAKPSLYHPVFFSTDLIDFQITPFKTMAFQLALEARIEARNGRTTLALENIAAIDRMGEHAHQSPRLINALLLIRIQEIKKDALEIIMAESPRGSKFQAPLPLKSQDRIAQTMHRAMTHEWSFEVFNMSDLLIHRPSLNPFAYLNKWDSETYKPRSLEGMEHFLLNILYRIFFLHDDLVSREAFWNQIQEFTKRPYYQSGEEFKKWEKELSESSTLGLYTTLGRPHMDLYFHRATRGQTHFLLTQLALATAAYRSDHGRYPGTLESLVPKYITEIPTDPFSGESLKMKAVKDGLILYGIGEDLKDNSGAAYDNETKKGDIAFYFGSAYTEHRLKPAIEKMKNRPKEEE